jgi:hypothetical protein
MFWFHYLAGVIVGLVMGISIGKEWISNKFVKVTDEGETWYIRIDE